MEIIQKVKLSLLVLFMCLCSTYVQAQNQVININVKNATLKQVFKVIEKQTTYRISYRNDIVDNKPNITISRTNANVSSVLNDALRGRSLGFRIVSNKSIVIYEKELPTKVENTSAKTTALSGTIVDENGDPIMGASVYNKRTKSGAISDINGRFALEGTSGDEISITYLGYTTLHVKGTGNMSLKMEPDAKVLEDVVVVGYGTQKKVNLSGSVAQVDSKTLTNRPISSVSAGLQGLMPGITVNNTSGAPGYDNGSIHIRGIGTLNNSSPYILVDGVESSLNAIDPNDIESISVLKDASSAAIYGSKASNGVILVTTKRGNSGKAKVSYSGYFGVQNATKLVDRMSSAEYADYYNKVLTAAGKPARFTDEEIQKFKDGSDPYNYPNIDWYDLAFKTGIEHRHNVNVTGGTDRTHYMASFGYLHQTGILPHARREQFNGRTNLDMAISNAITGHRNLSFIRNNYSTPTNSYVGGGEDQIIRQLNVMSPWIPNKLENGQYGTISDGNPMAWLDSGETLDRENRNFIGQIGLDYKILDGLVLKFQGSYAESHQHYKEFIQYIYYNDSKQSDPNHLDESESNSERTNLDLYLNYDKTFGLAHHFKAMGGWHTEAYNYRYLSAYRKSFPTNDLQDMNAGDESTMKNGGNTRKLRMVSYFGRLNYDYADKYLVEANFRADASSRFAKGHRWGYFPSFSAAWRLTEESFMQSTKGWLDNLKIRASWGKLGNQDALSDYYPWMNTYNVTAKYPFDGSLVNGYYQANYRLETISWEKSTTWGIGLDFGLFHSLTGSIDYYNRKTTGIIMDVDVPSEFGLGAYKDNIGSMRNEGVEIQLNYQKQLNKSWGLQVAANFAYNKNKILNLGPGIDVIGSGDNRNVVGQPYQVFYLYKATGKFFQSQEEADAYTAKYGNPFGKKFMAGDVVYEDTNGDGKLTSQDRVYCKNTTMPAITYGFNIGATYKNFDLMTVWQGVGKVSHRFVSEVFGQFRGDNSHPSTYWEKSWTIDPEHAKMPRLYEADNSASAIYNSTFWLFNTSYLRLKTLQFGYTLPKNLLKGIGISNLRIYYAGENLLTFDNLPINVDPETTSERSSSYPLLRSHSFGVNISF